MNLPSAKLFCAICVLFILALNPSLVIGQEIPPKIRKNALEYGILGPVLFEGSAINLQYSRFFFRKDKGFMSVLVGIAYDFRVDDMTIPNQITYNLRYGRGNNYFEFGTANSIVRFFSYDGMLGDGPSAPAVWYWFPLIAGHRLELGNGITIRAHLASLVLPVEYGGEEPWQKIYPWGGLHLGYAFGK